jgi:ATP-dependent Clp endopeptidase proteolytic subunit ClpP
MQFQTPTMTLEPLAKAGGVAYSLMIWGAIGESWFEESVSAKNVLRQIRSLDPDSEIHIRINSPGGSVVDGLAIYNTLKEHRGTKTVIVDGLAASAASLIAMAGDSIEVPETSMVMIHGPSSGAWGNAKDLRQTADVLDKFTESMVNAYASKTGKPHQEIRDMLLSGEDYWYSGSEAVAAGFADKIREVPKAPKPNSKTKAMASFYAMAFSPPPHKEKVMPETETPTASIEAATVPAPVVLPDLDAVKAEIEAKAATEIAALRAEIESRTAAAEAAIAQARADAEAAQARLATEVEAREVREATEAFSKAFANLPGKAEDTAKALRAVARANPEAETQIRAVLASVNGILANAKVVGFEPMGGTGIVDEDPEAKVARLAAEKRKTNPSLTIEQARAMVYDENRELLRDTREKD